MNKEFFEKLYLNKEFDNIVTMRDKVKLKAFFENQENLNQALRFFADQIPEGDDIMSFHIGPGRRPPRSWNIKRYIDFLLESGAEVNAQDENGETALHWAAKRGKIEAIKSLVDAGGKWWIENKNGETAMDVAGKGGYFEFVRCFLVMPVYCYMTFKTVYYKNPFKLDYKNSLGNTIIHTALSDPYGLTWRHVDLVALIERAPFSSINDKNKLGATPMQLALKFGDQAWLIILTLLQNGATFEKEIQEKLSKTVYEKIVKKYKVFLEEHKKSEELKVFLEKIEEFKKNHNESKKENCDKAHESKEENCDKPLFPLFELALKKILQEAIMVNEETQKGTAQISGSQNNVKSSGNDGNDSTETIPESSASSAKETKRTC